MTIAGQLFVFGLLLPFILAYFWVRLGYAEGARRQKLYEAEQDLARDVDALWPEDLEWLVDQHRCLQL